ncbi:MAG TPA: RNA pyrophosphohydrolase [Rhizomicrobium sp.]|nr:RNA pyrophosphohydrolase [Rhizomicrobium sp.]
MPASSDLPYRPCVGIMLLDHRGRVFVGKRIDQTVEGWQMPQGGIDKGETPRQAAMRELLEEVGTGKAEIIAEMEDWVTYDLPPHLVGVAFHGRYKGQTQKWFALRFTGSDADINLAAHEPEFSAFQWVTLDELPGLIVPFKRATYEQVIAAFRPLAER